ncbi:MAG: Mov34/MPN/PAD-1 family protein [Thermoanaerobaculia bacterium]
MSRESQSVRIDPPVLREIARQATAAYPDEAFGALLGPHRGRVRSMHSLPRCGVPASLAGDDARELITVGSWRSHPEGLALPREADRRRGRDGRLMLIVAVDGVAGAGEITGWRVEPANRHFREVAIEDGVSLVSTLERRLSRRDRFFQWDALAS